MIFRLDAEQGTAGSLAMEKRSLFSVYEKLITQVPPEQATWVDFLYQDRHMLSVSSSRGPLISTSIPTCFTTSVVAGTHWTLQASPR